MKNIFILLSIMILLSSCFSAKQTETLSETGSTDSGTLETESGADTGTQALVMPKVVTEAEKNPDTKTQNKQAQNTQVKQDVEEIDKEVEELTDKLFSDLSNIAEDAK